MINKGKICSTEDCEDDAKCMGLCTNCYAHSRYWINKSAEQLEERELKLRIWKNRMLALVKSNALVKSKARVKVTNINKNKGRKTKQRQRLAA